MKLIFDSNICRFANRNYFNFKIRVACGVSKTWDTAFLLILDLLDFSKKLRIWFSPIIEKIKREQPNGY
ncbi:MAG: hypothetical protein CML14_10075 [Puniceicoccaceae bacterium]|nr:hypothetical protein [Puniceicoccaceae bacterium]|tara:strand:+ start:405 stop:611 length:207 start_codon:yes stop_codon:yes gene_type:complete